VIARQNVDVSDLPTLAFGPAATLWWAVIGLLAIEGTALAMVGAAYFYLRGVIATWPPPGTPPPALGAASAEVVILLVSVGPMMLVDGASRRRWLSLTRIGLSVVVLCGFVSMGLRALQFAGALHCRWDSHAYGSVIWFLLGMHAAHVVTSTLENVLLLAVLFRHAEPKDFVDAQVGAVYWYFIVAAWIGVYGLVYLVPRWS
jgi:cytochrome c oxidase subunit III